MEAVMAYTALEDMRKANVKEFGDGAGPEQPYLFPGAENKNDLKCAALRFIHDRCEGPRFDAKIDAEEKRTGKYRGTSIEPNQIPYNMQMDIDRLCLERELEHFIDSGTAEDAYNVYYCYLEMFLGRYGKSKKMVELLGEFETNGSSLLMKHRDHYSHSVYVFTMGLAIYETNSNFRKAFKSFYHFDTNEKNKAENHRAANFFLEYWGLTSLFHDIGYPFELPFEQIMSYFEVNNQKRGENNIYFSYRNIEKLTALSDQSTARLEKIYGKTFHSITEVLAYDVTKKLGDAYGFSESYLMSEMEKKPSAPDHFNYYMDHAFFSAVRLYRELVKTIGVNDLETAHFDALSAILLHNSLYKFSIAFYKSGRKIRLPMILHPLAYLLMLCDELQCWDRTAYGRNSRTELQPMAATFDFSGNAVKAEYIYDEDEQHKIDQYKTEYSQWKDNGSEGEAPRLKAYSDMAEDNMRFQKDIELIVDTSKKKGIPLTVTCKTGPAHHANKHMYLSASNFLHMHDFAVALNARYSHEDHEDEISTEQLEAEFAALSLEYKLSNINQVKGFSKYLNKIQCFYTDRPVDFELLKEFSLEQINKFGPMEHTRWVREHHIMGWRFGTAYKTAAVPRGVNEDEYRKMLREHMRCHEQAMDGEPTDAEITKHYWQLTEKDKEKDWKPFNSMLKLIKKFDGLRIYKLAGE